MTQEVRHRRHCEHERTSGIDIPLLGNPDSGSLVLAWLGSPLAVRE